MIWFYPESRINLHPYKPIGKMNKTAIKVSFYSEVAYLTQQEMLKK